MFDLHYLERDKSVYNYTLKQSHQVKTLDKRGYSLSFLVLIQVLLLLIVFSLNFEESKTVAYA